MKKKKVLFVATVVKTHMMQFHLPYLKMFQDMGWETAVAAKNDYEDPKDCVIPFCDHYYNIPFARIPWKPDNIQSYRMLKTIIDFYDGGPVGLDTLAATVGEEAITLEDVYEPYLMQIGFLSRTPRGRCVTRLAYEHLGLRYGKETAAQDQLNFFKDESK